MVTSMSLPQGRMSSSIPFQSLWTPRSRHRSGWIDRGGYNISLVGEGEIAKIVRMARMFGFPPLQS